MSRRIGIIALAACVFAFCLALVGCAGGVNKANYVGTWTLESSSDEGMSEDTFEKLRMLDLEVTLVLEEEGTGTLDLFGDVTNLTWEAETNTEGTIVIGEDENDKALITLADDKLTIEASDGTKMTFAKSGSASSAKASESAASAASAGSAASSDAASAEAEPAASAEAASAEPESAEEATSQEAEPEGSAEAATGEEAADSSASA